MECKSVIMNHTINGFSDSCSLDFLLEVKADKLVVIVAEVVSLVKTDLSDSVPNRR